VRGGAPEVKALKWQGSGDIAALAKANCFLVVPADRDKIAAGDQSIGAAAEGCGLGARMAKLSHYGKRGEVSMVDRVGEGGDDTDGGGARVRADEAAASGAGRSGG